ncbi:protein lin-41-like, partial [Saccostrea cucullata]|uniref:protein lin-41-like n=1 Tax=Saccostrea cuccullata TaxID=36930 RepID=UPI002ED5683D
LSAAITKHGEEWHREIDKVVTKLIAKVEELKTNQLQLLQKHLDEIKKIISENRDEINSIDDVFGFTGLSKYDFTLNVDKYRKFPRPIVLPSPKLITPMKISGDELCSLFGNFHWNLDICVADFRADAVIVVSEAGKLRFKYVPHITTSKNQLFSPRGITTDSQSHILTADITINCVHIIDQDGQFICHIDCGLNSPWGLCVDTKNNLFVAEFRDKQVKKIKYLKES